MALESTIISHGMSYPENYKCALEVEDIISSKGCVPATIAIFDGYVRVGLSKGKSIPWEGGAKFRRKVSRRDIAPY